MVRIAARRRLFTAVAVAVVGVVVSGAAVSPAYADPINVTGTVTDLATGDPIEGACVSAVVYETGAEAATACTGADGSYTLAVPDMGYYKVRSSAAGYHELWAHNKTNSDVADGTFLSPGWPLPPFEFRMFHQTASVTGRITDSAGAPVESVDVRVVPEGSSDIFNSPFGYSGADGRYTIDGLIPGRYMVVFNSGTYGMLYAQGSDTAAGATIYELADGASVTVDDSFKPLGSAEITVVDAATGAPITRACVTASAFGPVTVCDSADGVYRFTNLRPPGATFTASAGTHQSASVSLAFAGGQTARATIALTKAEAIVTRVVDRRTNKPVTDVCAFVTPVDSHGLSPNQIRNCPAADGRLVIPLPGAPGTYQIYIEPQGASSYGAQWVGLWGGTGNRELALPVTVAAGANVTIPTIRMDKAGSITGTVRKPDGTPAGNVCALPYPFDPDGQISAHPACTDAAGRYTLTGLGPYHWPVLFMGDSWIWSGNKPNRYAAAKVHVTSGRAATMDAVVPAGTVITGQVRNTAGAIVRTSSVRAFNAVTGDYAARTAGANFGQPYQLQNLGAQHVRIEYRVAVGSTNTICWYESTTDPQQAKPFRVKAGPTVTLDLTGCG